MNREIKFRIEHLGELFEVIEIDFKGRKVLVNNGDWFSFDIGTLLQFTGLKDKSGKEIYEGDIIKTHKTSNSRTVGFEGNIYQVIFKNGSYELIKKGSQEGLSILCSYDRMVEIIGNTFENPELLGSEEKT